MKIKLGFSTLESRENPSAAVVDALVLTAPVADPAVVTAPLVGDSSSSTQNYFGGADPAPDDRLRDPIRDQLDALLLEHKRVNRLPGGPDFVGPPLPPSLGGPYPLSLPPLLDPNTYGGPPVPVGTKPPFYKDPPIRPLDGIPLGPTGY